MNEQDRAMTIKEVAKFLNISGQMVYNLVNDGSLPAFKIGSASRIMHSDVMAFIEQQKKAFARTHGEEETPSDENVFAVRHLTTQQGKFRIQDVTFEFPKGKILTLLGPSGSGKTLLLKAIAGLLPLENGSIFLGKTRLDDIDPQKRRVGFVFEDYALFPMLNAERNIEFPLKVRGRKKRVRGEETAQRLRELQIDPAYLEMLPSELPEGMKQLVGIAREKNHEVDLFIMDEPMTHLDAAHHAQMRLFIQKIVRDLGKTTLFSANNPEDALALSDYIGIMAEGQILQFGETWEVYNHPVNLLAMEMTSRMRVNTLKVEIADGMAQPHQLPVEHADGAYMLAFRADEVSLSADGGIAAKVGISKFVDGQRKIAFCKVNDDQEIELLVPADAAENIRFRPLRPQFFLP